MIFYPIPRFPDTTGGFSKISKFPEDFLEKKEIDFKKIEKVAFCILQSAYNYRNFISKQLLKNSYKELNRVQILKKLLIDKQFVQQIITENPPSYEILDPIINDLDEIIKILREQQNEKEIITYLDSLKAKLGFRVATPPPQITSSQQALPYPKKRKKVKRQKK